MSSIFSIPSSGETVRYLFIKDEHVGQCAYIERDNKTYIRVSMIKPFNDNIYYLNEFLIEDIIESYVNWCTNPGYTKCYRYMVNNQVIVRLPLINDVITVRDSM